MNSDFLQPLRVLHGRLHEWKINRQREYALWKYLNLPFGKKVYIIGTPTHSNLGDSAIVVAEMWFLEQCGVSEKCIKELTMNEYVANEMLISRYTPAAGLIAQLGGGNMGSQWLNEEYLHRSLLINHVRNSEIIFPQTIHYLDDEEGRLEEKASIPIYNGRKGLTMIAREQKSYEIMRELYPETSIVITPDIVLSADVSVFGVEPQTRNGVCLCFRADAEKAMTVEEQEELTTVLKDRGLSYRLTDMHADNPITKENRLDRVREKMEEFACAELVITDRLHGMIFAAITGTPCIVFSNYNHKVKGTYEWIKYLPYIRYVESVEEAKQVFPELLAMEECQFDNTPLQPYFDQIKEVVKQYV